MCYLDNYNKKFEFVGIVSDGLYSSIFIPFIDKLIILKEVYHIGV